VQYLLFKVAPAGYYYILVILHVLNVLILYKIFLEVGFSRIAVTIGAMLFLASSLNFQSISWIVCQISALSTLFFLLGFLIFIKYQDYRSNMAYLSIIFLYLLGLLTIENCITLPLVLFIYNNRPTIPGL
jgi:hypothetical protein